MTLEPGTKLFDRYTGKHVYTVIDDRGSQVKVGCPGDDTWVIFSRGLIENKMTTIEDKHLGGMFGEGDDS